MGSSSKKKKEKQKDFQKPKFKVGKAKPKASNFTDTSFQSKSIVIGEQFHGVDGDEDITHSLKHNLSVASSARSDKQRKDALAFLTDRVSSNDKLTISTSAILIKVLPLVSDSSTPVRAQLLKLLRSLPPADVENEAERVIIFVRAGMTHLSSDISSDTLSVMEWLLDVASDSVVSCPGGWVKTLNTFCALMGWTAVGNKGWSTTSKPTLRAKDATARARQMMILARFLQAGLKPEKQVARTPSDYWDYLYRMPRLAQPFEYLNLFGGKRDEDADMYTSRDMRQGVFHRRFLDVITKGVDGAKKEGGACGRAAAVLDKTIRDGMDGFEPPASTGVEEVLGLI